VKHAGIDTPSPMFRAGAGAPETSEDHGQALDSPIGDLLRGGAVAIAFFVGLLGWAALTPLEAAVVAQGVIKVSGNRQAVQHPDGGVVKALRVREGQSVKQGDVLIELSDVEAGADAAALGALRIELEARRAGLLSEESDQHLAAPARWAGLDGPATVLAADVLERQRHEISARRAANASRLLVLERRLRQLTARRPGQDSERAAIADQKKIIDEEIEGLSSLLERGLTPMNRLRLLERERASLSGRLARLDAEVAETLELIVQAEGEIASLKSGLSAERAAELRDIETQLAEVEQRHAAASSRLERRKVRSPASGEVVGLTAFTVGGVVAPGERIMEIVPGAGGLVVEAAAPPTSGDDLRRGQMARLRFVSLGGHRAPVLDGQVAQVSADRLVDANTGAGFFKVEVSVSENELAKLGSGADLRPGLPVEVVLPTRSRTALDYIVEPLNAVIWRSFREE
jgi:HlyD family type I secretion membrane fusion protein